MTWLRIVHSGDWCLRLALCTHSGACREWLNEWIDDAIIWHLVDTDDHVNVAKQTFVDIVNVLKRLYSGRYRRKRKRLLSEFSLWCWDCLVSTIIYCILECDFLSSKATFYILLARLNVCWIVPQILALCTWCFLNPWKIPNMCQKLDIKNGQWSDHQSRQWTETKPPCNKTELKRCNKTEMRWNKKLPSRSSPERVVILWPRSTRNCNVVSCTGPSDSTAVGIYYYYYYWIIYVDLCIQWLIVWLCTSLYSVSNHVRRRHRQHVHLLVGAVWLPRQLSPLRSRLFPIQIRR